MVEGKGKGLLLAVAAGAAFVGAAIYYKFVYAKSQKPVAGGEEVKEVVVPDDELMRAMKAANVNIVRRAPDGQTLDSDYILQLLSFVAHESQKRRSTQAEAALRRRRESFATKNWDELHEVIKNEFEEHEAMFAVVLGEVLAHLTSTSQQELDASVQNKVAGDKEFAMAARLAKKGTFISDSVAK